MKFSSLPLEVLQITLRLIPKGSLAPASQLPYRLYAGDIQRQTEFLKTIIDEDENENEHTPRLSHYIKHLSVESTLNKEELEVFALAVVKMKNLERLDWCVSFLKDIGWYATLVLFYQELPKLRSLGLTTAENEIPLGDLDECVAFTNLRELSVTFDVLTVDDIGPDSGLPRTFVDLIRGARNIESLCLHFTDDGSGSAPWESTDLLSELVLDHFPNLRMLEIRSQHLVLIDDHNGPEFRQFIQNHSQIEKIRLLTGGYDYSFWPLSRPQLIVTPADMEIMPCIRHFAGPGLLIEALLKSKLAKKIELLEFHEPTNAAFGSLWNSLLYLDSWTLPELPSLKGLGIFADIDEAGKCNE
ncbi:unnamed protein product [Rhizoctonia solani]|uniref:F-box domain-containing protein n=1 Tax=Rhizoctonia solani TaxID=456999 RepID=A0A8H2X342_9AGAM|nr:unnamed protein product [Rhizoctonia solani]